MSTPSTVPSRPPMPRAHTTSPRVTLSKPKARSISSLPLPHHPLAMVTSPSASSPPVLGSTSSSTSTSASASASASASTSAARSPQSPLYSPSRLPDTDTVSYFPPFETMGSASDPEPEPEAGPSQPRPRTHVKVRSLGSIAGFVSWGLALTSQPSPDTSASASCVGIGAGASAGTSPARSPDDEAVVALTKRFTPKRRVLEPITVSSNDITQQRVGGAHKRRMKSEIEIEGILGHSRTPSSSEADEDTVEGIVQIPSRRRNRPALSLPIPPPAWRFPMPSPPVTCLSPDIPLEQFSTEIDNPAASATSSPARHSPLSPLAYHHDLSTHSSDTDDTDDTNDTDDSDDPRPSPSEQDLDEIDKDLSPTLATPPPSTPDKERKNMREKPWAHHRQRRNLGTKLCRTTSACSGRSSDSKETIRAEGEITPKAGKGWRVMEPATVVRV